MLVQDLLVKTQNILHKIQVKENYGLETIGIEQKLTLASLKIQFDLHLGLVYNTSKASLASI